MSGAICAIFNLLPKAGSSMRVNIIYLSFQRATTKPLLLLYEAGASCCDVCTILSALRASHSSLSASVL
jgi:hypothetical protein